jgi:prepilin peptidase CpaA
MLVQASILIFIALMLAAAFLDATRFTIPNWLSAAVAIAFFPAALILGMDWAMFGFHLLGGVLALLIGMAIFAAGWAGGGDAKLFAAAGLWFGWSGLTSFLMHTALAGGALVLLLLIARRALPLAGIPARWTENTALAPGGAVPYGIALAGGAMWSLPGSVWLSGF